MDIRSPRNRNGAALQLSTNYYNETRGEETQPMRNSGAGVQNVVDTELTLPDWLPWTGPEARKEDYNEQRRSSYIFRHNTNNGCDFDN